MIPFELEIKKNRTTWLELTDDSSGGTHSSRSSCLCTCVLTTPGDNLIRNLRSLRRIIPVHLDEPFMDLAQTNFGQHAICVSREKTLAGVLSFLKSETLGKLLQALTSDTVSMPECKFSDASEPVGAQFWGTKRFSVKVENKPLMRKWTLVFLMAFWRFFTSYICVEAHLGIGKYCPCPCRI